MRNLTKQIGVRVIPRDYKLLQEIAKNRGIDVSDFVRQLIRNEFAKLDYLGKDAKKALGIFVERPVKEEEDRSPQTSAPQTNRSTAARNGGLVHD